MKGETMSQFDNQNAPVAGTPSHTKEDACGYVLWEYTGEAWQIKKDESTLGAIPSAPPVGPGRFVGQLRATPSVAASA
jgi:hypothetical protein